MNLKLEEITLEDLQEQHRQYAEVIGLENLLALAKEFGGTQIYIPQMDDLIKLAKYKKIAEEFDGSNILQLTQKYGVSESTVRRVVREQISGKRQKQMDGQMSLADLGI